MGPRSAPPDYNTHIEDLIAGGDRVAWRYAAGGSHIGGPLLGVPATRNRLTWTGTAVLRLQEGKIEEIWDNVDLLAIYVQLGAVSLPDESSLVTPLSRRAP